MKRVLFLLLGCVCGGLSAREVTVAEAKHVAEVWAERNAVFAGETVQVQTPIAVADADGAVLYYKVMLGSRGLLIVSGDTNLDPVIASLPEATSPELPEGHPLTALLFSDLSERRTALVSSGLQVMALAEDDVTETVDRNNSRWEDLLGNAGGIQTFALNSVGAPARVYSFPKPWSTRQITHWNQTSSNEYVTLEEYSLYNRELKHLQGSPLYAGCVAIAGSAILEFFRVSGCEAGIQCTYQLNYNNNTTVTIGGEYNWDCLPKPWTRGCMVSEDARTLVGKVAHDVGMLVGTNYKEESSSAEPTRLAESLPRFGLSGAYVLGPSLETQVYPQVRAGAPVYLNIQDSIDKGGHAVVAVGYGEDDDNHPYTRLFMGWGGVGDAWYALPKIRKEGSFSYDTLLGVVTRIAKDENRAAICGRVTNANGEGVPYHPVTVTFTYRIGEDAFATEKETRTVTTGLYGEYALRGPTSVQYTIQVDDQTRIVSDQSGYPPAIDFTIEQASVPQVETDAQAALDRAIQEGKLIFVLSGTAWDEACTDIKKVLASIGPTFNDNFILYINDLDYGLSSMNVGAPGYAVFAPRTFDLSQGANGNTALARGTETSEETIRQAVADALEQWEDAELGVTLEIVGETIAVGEGNYALRVTYSDGLVFTPTDVTWSVLSGTATISSTGALTFTAAETITLQAEVLLEGETYRATLEVRTVLLSEIESIAITGVEGDTILLEETPYPIFTCLATLKDGTVCQVTPEWKVSESEQEIFQPVIDAETGVLTCRQLLTRDGENNVLTVTATYSGCTATRAFDIYGHTRVMVTSWELVLPKDIYPGGIVKLQVNSLEYIEAGKRYTTTDATFAEYRLVEVVTGTNTEITPPPHSFETMEIAIPLDASSGAKTFYLEARKKGGNHPDYIRGGYDQMGVIPLQEAATAGKEMGYMPYGWLQQQFYDEANPNPLAGDDTDNDGYKNWEEYVLGTDPADKESTLKVNIHVSADGSPELTWNEHPGRTYQLLGADTLDGPWDAVRATSRFFKVNVTID